MRDIDVIIDLVRDDEDPGVHKWDGHHMLRLVAEIERLRATLTEVVTNGRWTNGEQRGEWQISPDVYALAAEALERKADD